MAAVDNMPVGDDIYRQTFPPQPDERDVKIYDERMAAFDEVPGSRVGDFVQFADGVERRISHIWFDESVQTSDGGSFYLGDGYVSFSGSLHPGVPIGTLRQQARRRQGDVWFFHHDHWQAHNDVHAGMLFRVFACSLRSDERP